MKFLNRLFDILPTPFWVYASAIVAGTTGLLPNDSPVYDQIVKHVLPFAIATMLFAVPVKDVLRMGRQAALAMGLASGTVFVAQVLAYLLLIHWLPTDAWKAVGALLGTWIGGSANMIAVKEILQMDPRVLPSLIVTDTLLSYSWMALLLGAVRYQSHFHITSPLVGEVVRLGGRVGKPSEGGQTTAGNSPSVPPAAGHLPPRGGKLFFVAMLIVLAVGEISIFLGTQLKILMPQLSANAWALLIVSMLAVALSSWVAPLFRSKPVKITGAWLLYAVLFAIGVRTNVQGTLGSSIYVVYGVLAFALHGLFLWQLGRRKKLPLSLLATASQANIGGAASAPIVAEAYQPGIGYLGVLMAVAGAIAGTYAGLLGAGLCRWLGSLLLGHPL